MRPVLRSSLVLLGLATVVGACGFNSTMERAVPVDSHCPAEARRSAVSGPPDTTEIRWYRAAQDRDIDLSSRWCATVGEPVFRPDPVPGFPAWTQGRQLEAYTWNVNAGGGDLFAFLQAEAGLDCSDPSAAVASEPGPLVLLVQEAWRRSDRMPVVESDRDVPRTVNPDRGPDGGADIVGVAERCGLALFYVASARNGPDSGDRPREDKGNAILASVPLTSPIAIDLPFEAGRKVAVAATVQAPGGERVRVVSAHFDVASTLTRTLMSGNQTRARQADGLIEGLRRAEDDGPLNAVTLVGGDFNSWSARETALKRMRAAFPESPEWDGEATWRPLRLPVDHVFFRRGPFDNVSLREYSRLEDDYGSDHYGRRIVVDYAPSPPPSHD